MSAFARSYSKAFLEAAPAGYDVDGFLERADAIRRAILGEPRLKAFFGSPAVPAEPKKKALDELARKVGLDDFGRRFFQLVLANRRLLELTRVLVALREEADRASGVIEGRVTVAAPLGDAEHNQISQALSKTAGRRVRLTLQIDEKILGGFVARVGSELFDASVQNAIERFRQQVSKGAKG
jgi:F-type H+-transporting ATPase subunit delta